MHAAYLFRVAGLCAMLWNAGLSPAPPSFEAHEGCPQEGCQIAPPPLPSGPLDPPAPVVTLKVRVPACGLPGQELEYRYFIENCSPADAHHVIVKNPLPANVKFVRASPAPHQKEPELQWNFETMHGGAKCEISVIVVPTGIEDVKNCVRIQYEHGQCVTTRIAQAQPGEGPFPPFPMMPPAEGKKEPPEGKKEPPEGKKEPPKVEPVPAEGLAKLKLLVEGPKERYANMPAKLIVSVVNEGKAAATNLLLRATLPEKAEFVSASDDGIHMASQVAWLLKDLEPGGKRVVELTYKSLGAGERCVKLFALADRNVTAQEELCTTFRGVSALLLEMFDREDPVAVGGDTSFPITVQNTGSAPATNLTIRARVPAQMVLARTMPAEHRLAERAAEGQWLIFGPTTLEAGGKTEFEVFVKATATGDARFHIEMTADQLESGAVIEEESTIVYDENGKVPGRMLSRKKR